MNNDQFNKVRGDVWQLIKYGFAIWVILVILMFAFVSSAQAYHYPVSPPHRPSTCITTCQPATGMCITTCN